MIDILSVRFLPSPVARGIIVAPNEGTPIAAPHFRTPQKCRVSPNDLCIMPTRFARGTRIRVIVVIRLLSHPHAHGISAEHLTVAHCKVLTVLPTGMDKIAVVNVFSGIVLSKTCYLTTSRAQHPPPLEQRCELSGSLWLSLAHEWNGVGLRL